MILWPTIQDSESSVLGEIVKGTPASQQAKSPSKPKDKRKLDKAPKHPEMQPPAVKPTKRTARKSIANAPATVPQKITRVGRIPKISGLFDISDISELIPLLFGLETYGFFLFYWS